MSDANLPGIIPIEGTVEAKASWAKRIFKLELDSEIFPPRVNKTKKIGRIKQRNFLIKCDGQGIIGFKELIGIDQRMERIAKFKKNGWITEKEFEEKKKEILKDI